MVNRQKENTFSKNASLTESEINILNNSISKTGISILLALYNAPQTQQKILAAKVGTSTTSLSNILRRIENINPQLIRSERAGRSKYFSLTKIGELYASQVLITQKLSQKSDEESDQDKTLLDNTLDILYRFQNTVGSDWLLVMDDMLSANRSESKKENDLYDMYKTFLKNMKLMQIHKKTDFIYKVYDVLSNKILIQRLDRYLEKTLYGYYDLEPLFHLEKQDLEKAMLLINHIFTELKPRCFEPHKMLKSSIDFVLPEQYVTISKRISVMIDEFDKYKGSIMDAVEDWKNTYCIINASLYHIAEKCHTIYIYSYKTKGLL